MNIGSLNGMQLSNVDLRETKNQGQVQKAEDGWTNQLDKAYKDECTKANNSKEENQDFISCTKKLKNKLSIIESPLKVNSDEQLSSKEIVDAIQEQILAILMQYLQVSEVDIRKTLSDMGYNTSDLLEQKNFSQFLMKQVNLSAEDILNGTIDIKNISKAFSEIEVLKDELAMESLELVKLTHELGKEVELGDDVPDMVTSMDGVQENLVNVNDEQGMMKKLSSKEIKFQSNEGTNVIDMTLKLDLGIDLPIQMPLEVQKNLWHTYKDTGLKGLYVNQEQPIVLQMVEKIELSALRESNEITMELSPRSLGKLSIKLSETQGMITAQIKVENDRVKEALLQDITVLKEKLEEQGLQVGSFQVDVKEQPQHSAMEKQKQKSSKRIQEIMDKQVQQLEMENKANRIEVDSDNEINLMA